ncbi:MAG: toprim domain-containing protein [Treponema sp.]|nr:toprim domain-containing protein [Treponema sp.]
MHQTNRTEAKEMARGRLAEYLERITERKGKQYICPLCGSGTGANKTPAGKLNDDFTYHCFSCNFHGDIFSLVGRVESIADSADRFKRVYEIFNLFTDEKPKTAVLDADYTEYFKECHARAGETDYFSFRGISDATIKKFMLGYDPVWRSPKALRDGNKPLASQRIIIPTERGNYIARAVDPNVDPRFKVVKEGASEIFNKKALYGTEPVFIVEGEIDALSVIEADGQSLALGGLGNKNKFITLLRENSPTAPIIILSLDNDNAGRKAQAEIADALRGLKMTFLEQNISGAYKDPNEHLTSDSGAFKRIIRDAQNYALIYALEADQIAREKYINEMAVTSKISNFLGQVKASADTPAIPTNFPELDKILDEGLYEGLYILGAISSLGKTSFALQIADQIAQQGQDVLIFSLEMAMTELMAKSISRLTYLECGDAVSHAKTTRGITAGKRYENYSRDERDLIDSSVKKYAEYTDRLFIYEGIGDIGVSQVRDVVAEHIKATGSKPVIIIDYLQILAPFEPRASDKQNTDKAVFELKRLSRDFKIPILGISSLNRASYTAEINMAAFKESGAIEYSSDVLLGLQFASDGTEITSAGIDRLKRENVRKIELKILKNRNGATGDSITYDYYPMSNYFKETGKKQNSNGGKRL